MTQLPYGRWKADSDITIVSNTGGRITLRAEEDFGDDEDFCGIKFHQILNSHIENENGEFVVYLSRSDI